MATIKSPWVGAASGRLGESTYYRKNGKTLARALPSTVTNPRTKAQMLQRIVFAVVAQAASQMKNVVNHSFEAKKYGEESLNYFRSRALADMRAKAINAVNAQTPVAELAYGCFTRKGIATLPTNNYLISEGSLQPYSTTEVFIDGGNVGNAIVFPDHMPATVNGEDITFSDKDLLAALGLSIGQQASFCRIEIGAPAYESDVAGMSQKFGNFRINRLRSNPDQGDEETALVATVEDDANGTYRLHVQNTRNIIVEEEFDLIIIYDADNHRANGCFAMPTGHLLDEPNIAAMTACSTCVRSEYSATTGKWLRSTQRLTYGGNILSNFTHITGTSYTSAWESWQKAEAQLLTTDRLLNYEGLNP